MPTEEQLRAAVIAAEEEDQYSYESKESRMWHIISAALEAAEKVGAE